MLTLTRAGLYCPAGDFYIDPSRAVERALITHAHSDHARRGSKHYITVRSGVELLKARLGPQIQVQAVEYGKTFALGEVQISFHPAGHILGSAQIRMQLGEHVWVASGDYKRDPDPTCEPFEPVRCDVFVTEATFGTPAFTWPKSADLGHQIFEWWQRNSERGINSVLFAYSLGKAQRVLGLLSELATRPVYCDPSVTPLNRCYEAEGVRLAPTISLEDLSAASAPLAGELFLVPQSFLKSEQARLLGRRYETAFASGWMAQGRQGFRGSYDRGFVISDHADWKDLVRTILETGARRVYVQHRDGALVRHLRSLGLDAQPEEALREGNHEQLAFTLSE
jgi:putative mRNA 3-end processing factor